MLRRRGPYVALQSFLEAWAQHDPRPICLMIDDMHFLVGDSLVTVLRQLRAGFAWRPKGFPQSVILCGLRDLKNAGSVFNIKAVSLSATSPNPKSVDSTNSTLP